MRYEGAVPLVDAVVPVASRHQELRSYWELRLDDQGETIRGVVWLEQELQVLGSHDIVGEHKVHNKPCKEAASSPMTSSKS